MREALSRLRSHGVIVSRKGSGSYFRKSPSPDPTAVGAMGFLPIDSLAAVRRCFEFRTGVESEAAFFAALNHTPATLAAIREALEGMEAAATNGVVAVKADLEFHLSVARASGNEYFEAVMHSMRTPIEFAINLARSLTLTRPLDHLRTVQTEHVVLFEAIEARDKDAARAAMRWHIENTCKRVFDGPDGGAAPTPEQGGARPGLSRCDASSLRIHGGQARRGLRTPPLLRQVAYLVADVFQRQRSRLGTPGGRAAERRQFGSGNIDGDLDVAATLLERAGAAGLSQFPVLVGYAREDQGCLVRRRRVARRRRSASIAAYRPVNTQKSILEHSLLERTISRESRRGRRGATCDRSNCCRRLIAVSIRNVSEYYRTLLRSTQFD